MKAEKAKLSIPNSHIVYSSISIPYLLFTTQSDNFYFLTGKQIKATMIKIAWGSS